MDSTYRLAVCIILFNLFSTISSQYCPTCTPSYQNQCSVNTKSCTNGHVVMKGDRCRCCATCARQKGQTCNDFDGQKCAPGLICRMTFMPWEPSTCIEGYSNSVDGKHCRNSKHLTYIKNEHFCRAAAENERKFFFMSIKSPSGTPYGCFYSKNIKMYGFNPNVMDKHIAPGPEVISVCKKIIPKLKGKSLHKRLDVSIEVEASSSNNQIPNSINRFTKRFLEKYSQDDEDEVGGSASGSGSGSGSSGQGSEEEGNFVEHPWMRPLHQVSRK